MVLQEAVIEPDEAGLLEVGDGQVLYWEAVGSRSAVPAVYLHGGPGSGSVAGARRYFDRDGFRGVLFDQRGCGRSRPLVSDASADLSVNTTAHLVEDIERLRQHLGIDRWVVVGVSWGVTLGLVYAERYPERVAGMVLGAVNTGTGVEIDWITRQMGRVFPREWEQFIAGVPVDERGGDLAAAYARLLANPDPRVRADAAQQWCRWEDTHVSLASDWTPSLRYEDPTFRIVFARLVTHYWSHRCFLAEDQILNGINRLAGIPGVLIHGRYDISSPLGTAWNLHRSWPGSRLVALDDAGHGGGDFTDEFIRGLNTVRDLA